MENLPRTVENQRLRKNKRNKRVAFDSTLKSFSEIFSCCRKVFLRTVGVKK